MLKAAVLKKKVKQKVKSFKEFIMAELKIGGKTIKEIGDEARARRRAFTESFLPKLKLPQAI